REIRGEGSVKVTATSVDRLRLTLSYEPSRSRAAEVNYALIVSDGSEARKLFFGLDPGATEGLDAGLGEVELPPMPPSGVFEARLVGDDVQAPLGQGTYKDYRTGDASFTGEVVHELRFQRGDGSGIVISWSLPDGVFGRLQDLREGGSIDHIAAGTGGLRIDDASVTALRFTVSYGSSPPEAEVSVPITLTQGEVQKQLRVGLDPAATDGIDMNLGESELPPLPPSGVFEARLIGDDIDVAGLGLGSYRDYRHGRALMDTVVTHEILLQPAGDEPVTLSWNLPENAAGELKDVGGSAVDQQMTGRGDYVLPDAGITKLMLTLTYSSGAQGPGVVVDAPETGNSGEDIPIVITAGGDVPPRSASLFYRRGGERQYVQDDYAPDGASLRATIPAAFVTERGVEYYVSLDFGNRTVTDPAVDPENNPKRIRVAVPADSLTTPAGQYRMVSIPLDLTNPAFGEVVKDLGAPDRGSWRLARWRPGANPPEGTYEEAPDLESAFAPGTAFWLITSDARHIRVGAGRSVSTDGAYRLTLQPGWNQIGNPYSFPVSWSDVVSLFPEEVQGNVEPPRAFDGTQYLPPTDVLLPWEGYFVYYRGEAGTTADLLIPPLEAQAAGKRGRHDQFLAGVSYAVQISASGTTDGMKDGWNYVGLATDASDGSDRLDFYEAPGIGPHLRLSIVDGRSRFDGDFKPVNVQGQKWDVEIETIQADGTIPTRVPIKVDLKERGVRPPGFDIYVLDRDRGEYVALTGGHFATEAGGHGAVRHYTVVVGTEAFAESALGLDPSAPKEFGIEPSYPNPAESDATIRYYVPHTSTVHLQIFDLLGRRVRVLASGEQEPGVLTAHWDTRDDSGVPVASGVYFCRMTADGFSDTIQILVVRP
ncbi:MAG TPA: FlgD immunoglobulin-like domain containing protein, partial [Rhodothermales bacterium]|nr:FlgD immunoglobulin-like domain containing protein [Rhodothermales bacterium]